MMHVSLQRLCAWYRDSNIVNSLNSMSSACKSSSLAGRNSAQGCAFLLGAGPGDAELLTLKAYRILQQADVIMYDWLVGSDVVDLFPASVERIFVGKKCGQHSMKQTDICQIMVQYAQRGKTVVRVKGGDPAIFARAAEECQALAKYSIPFCIVPGITAASGASAYAGIPLTHRECAQSVSFITAHLKSAKSEPNWRTMVLAAQAQQAQTLVFYMGLKRLDMIMQRLMQNGLAASMPVAVIDQATTHAQAACIGTVADIAQGVAQQSFTGPAICIVGEVVNYRHQVNTELLAPNKNTASLHTIHA